MYFPNTSERTITLVPEMLIAALGTVLCVSTSMMLPLIIAALTAAVNKRNIRKKNVFKGLGLSIQFMIEIRGKLIPLKNILDYNLGYLTIN